MTDTTVTTEAPVTPPATTTPPAANTPESRTPDGTIKDLTQPLSSDKTTTPSTPPAEKTVPETYADFTVAEGQTLNKDLITKATPIFKELGLTQDQAQKLVSFQAELQKQADGASAKAYNDTLEGWRTTVLADSTLAEGGELKKDVQQNISNFKNQLPEALRGKFTEAMDVTGVGNHPAIVAALNEIGAKFKEGTHVSGGGPSAAGQAAPNSSSKPSTAKAMFPNLP